MRPSMARMKQLQRAADRGGRAHWLTPAIRSSYYPRRSFKALAKQYWEYGAAKGTLFGRGRPLQPRHFAPTAMVTGGPALWLLGRVSKRARRLLKLLGVVYIAGGMVMASRAAGKNGANPVRTFVAMATMHATYGAGFAMGWWRERGNGG